MSENVAHLFQEAIAKDKAGEAEESMKLLDMLLQYQADNRMGLFYRGSLKIRENDVAGAIKDWEQAFEGTDARAAARVQEQFHDVVESSLSHFAFETTVDPDDPIAHAAYGKAARLFGRSEAAQRHLQRAFELDRIRWREGLISAELLIRQGQTEPAQQVLQKILESQPENAEVQYTLGLFFQQTNSLAFALRHLEKAAALDPHFMPTRQLLADIYLLQGRFEQAETQYQFLVKYAPSARAHMGVAQCVKQQYRFDEALEQYRAAVALEPDHFGALCDLGALALQFGDFELAMDTLKKALEIDPNQPDIYGHLAKAAQQKGDIPEAIRSYRQLLAIEPNNTDASYSLANCLRSQGEYGEAAELLGKALERRLGDVQVSLELSDCLVHLDREGEAITLLRGCFANNPHHKELRQALSRLDSSVSAEEAPAAPSQNFEEFVTLAQLHLRQNRNEEAAQAFRSALVIKPDHPESLLHLGRIYANRGLLEPGADLVLQSYNANHDPEVLTELLAMASMMGGFERDDTMAQLVTTLLKQPDRRDWFDLLLPHGDDAVQRLLPELMQGFLPAVAGDHPLALAWSQHLMTQQPEPAPTPVAEPVFEPAPVPVSAPPPPVHVAPPAPVAVAPVEVATLPPLADVLPSFDLVCYVQPHKIDRRTTIIEEARPAPPPWIEGPGVTLERTTVEQWTALPPLANLPTQSPAAFYRELARSLADAGWVQEAASALARALFHEPTVGGNWMSKLLHDWCASLEKEGHLPTARQVCADWRRLFPQDELALAAYARLGDPPAPVHHSHAASHSWVSAVAEPFAVADAVLAFVEPASAAAEADFTPGLSSAPAPVPDPVAEVVAEPVPEPVAEVVAEPVAEVVAEPVPEPVAEVVAKPVPEPVAEVVAEPVPEPVAEVVAEPVPEPVAEVVAEPVPEPVAEVVAEPVPEPVAEVVAEPVPEPVAEVLPEPVSDLIAELLATPAPARQIQSAPVAPVPVAVAPAPAPVAPAVAAPTPTAAPPAVVPDSTYGIVGVSGEAKEVRETAPGAPPMRLSKPASISEFQKQLREYPDMGEALDWGWDLSGQQESEFLNIFRDLTKTELNEPRHVRNFARAYLRLGRPLLAVVQFQKFLNASPSSKGYRELADVYQKLNRERNAGEVLAKAEEMESKGL